MADMQTFAEMEAQFADEWILIGEPQTGPDLEVRAGKVLYHSKDRDAVYRQAIALRLPRFALFYTGDIPPDTGLVL